MKKQVNYVKRTQRDYSMSLKLQVAREIEEGHLSTYATQRKYGIQPRSTLTS
jgi:transposase-like protein